MEKKKEYKCDKCDKTYKNYKSQWKHNYTFHKDDKEEKIIKPKKRFICDKCNKNFCNLELIQEHCKNNCRPSIKSNNIYTFKTDTLGKIKYKNFSGGDIYIIQTEFNLKGFFKIGITTDLYKRLGQYRCGAVLEPKLHYYYPCKNIKETDKKLKEKLKKFNVKREIYTADNIDELRNTIKEIQKESDSLELEIVPESKECDVIGCNYCNIYFTNKQDLYLHENKNHAEEIKLEKENFEEGIYKCAKCDKAYNHYQSRWRHEKECTSKKITIDERDFKIEKMEKVLIEHKNYIKELRDEVAHMTKVLYAEFSHLGIFD